MQKTLFCDDKIVLENQVDLTPPVSDALPAGVACSLATGTVRVKIVRSYSGATLVPGEPRFALSPTVLPLGGNIPDALPARWSMKVVRQGVVEAGGSTHRPKFRPWFAKLQELAQLQANWDSYAAPAPSRAAIEAAERYLSILEALNWEPGRVAASVMGGIGVTHRQSSRKVYLEVYNNGTAHALFSDGTMNMQTEQVTTDIQSYFRFIGKARAYLHG